MHFVRWRGQSNNVYDFELHPIDDEFKDIAACYIFAKVKSDGKWAPIYVGQTQNLRARLAHHHATPCVARHRATHVCVYTPGMVDAQHRSLVERDLLRRLKPVCMTQRQTMWL